MKYCIHCGTALDDNAVFCSNCGKKTYEAPESGSGDPYTYEETAGNRSEDRYNFSAVPDERGYRGSSGRGRKKGPKTGLIIAIAAVLIAVCGVTAFALTGGKNFFKRTFSSPEDYYKYVEEEYTDDLADTISAVYGNQFLANLSSAGRGADFDMGISLSDSAKSMIADLAASSAGQSFDLSWLSSVSLSGRTDLVGLKGAVSMKALLNGTEIMDANMVMDMAARTAYVQIPLFSSDYLSTPLSIDSSSMYTLSQIQSIADICPDQDTFKKLLLKYVNAVIEEMHDVEKDKGTLSAGSISAEYTTLTVTIDSQTAAAVFNRVADLMADDAELRPLFNTYAQTLGYADSEAASMYDEAVSSLRQNAQNLQGSTSPETVIMTVYVDNKGEIRGRTVSVGSMEYFRLAKPKKGSDAAYFVQLEADSNRHINIEGSGTETNSQIKGDFSLIYHDGTTGYEVMKLSGAELDLNSIRSGYFSGSAEIRPGSGALSAMMQGGVSTVYSSILSGLSASYSTKSSASGSEMTVELLYNGNSIGTVSANASLGDAREIPAVTGVSSEEYTSRVSGSALSTLSERLKSAGVPSEYTDMIDMYAGYLG